MPRPSTSYARGSRDPNALPSLVSPIKPATVRPRTTGGLSGLSTFVTLSKTREKFKALLMPEKEKEKLDEEDVRRLRTKGMGLRGNSMHVQIVKTFYDPKTYHLDAAEKALNLNFGNAEHLKSHFDKHVGRVAGSLRALFNHYAAQFTAEQHLRARKVDLVMVNFANSTISPGELNFMCKDLRIVPELLTDVEVKWLWPQLVEAHEVCIQPGEKTKRVGREIGYEKFLEFLVLVAITNITYPIGRKTLLRYPLNGVRKQWVFQGQIKAVDACKALVQFLKLDKPRALRNWLADSRNRAAKIKRDAKIRRPGQLHGGRKASRLASSQATKRRALANQVRSRPFIFFDPALLKVFRKYTYAFRIQWQEFNCWQTQGLSRCHLDGCSLEHGKTARFLIIARCARPRPYIMKASVEPKALRPVVKLRINTAINHTTGEKQTRIRLDVTPDSKTIEIIGAVNIRVFAVDDGTFLGMARWV